MSISLNKPAIRYGIFLIIAAAVLNSLSLIYISYLLALPALTILVYVHLKCTNWKQSFYAGAFFGSLSSFILNYWMISVVADYASGSIFLGFLCYILSALILTIFFGAQFYLTFTLRFKQDTKLAFLKNAFIIASVWVLFELIRATIFSALPWLSYTAGITQGDSLYLIQSASYGGVFLLSFIIILTAYFIASAFIFKWWVLFSVPLGIITLQYILGFIVYKNTVSKINHNRVSKFSVALIMPGLTPETVWNESSADALIMHLLSLNQKANATKPSLIIWTETVVPWTYATDDDFINELSNITQLSNSYSLIGMNSAFSSTTDKLNNSVYFLNPKGKALGRYDKQDLLTLVEKPIFSENSNLILPFLSDFGLQMYSGKNNLPIETPWGKAGIMICNEPTNASLASDLIGNGAEFLVNIGNNSWFSDYFITRQHFYNCRLRAVENRKDLIINNNMGICGVVRANGDIELQAKRTNDHILTAEIYPNRLESSNPYILLFTVASTLVYAGVNRFKSLSIKSNK